jgi:hypothetical protein
MLCNSSIPNPNVCSLFRIDDPLFDHNPFGLHYLPNDCASRAARPDFTTSRNIALYRSPDGRLGCFAGVQSSKNGRQTARFSKKSKIRSDLLVFLIHRPTHSRSRHQQIILFSYGGYQSLLWPGAINSLLQSDGLRSIQHPDLARRYGLGQAQ